MQCPKCAAQTVVIDSRPFVDGVRRRHKCPLCEHRLTTREVPDEFYDYLVEMQKLQNRAAALLKEITSLRISHDDTRR